ncbi:MAG TPA: VWA domain-containing protein [Gemmatimonadaceae bacterium]|nr:VWA domain-containing protein [Gemmatimonadaceae bacterium]
MTTSDVVDVERVRRRLEALLYALYARHFAIAITDPPERVGWWRRYVIGRRKSLRASHALPATDGARIWLPHAVDGVEASDAVAVYRVLALLQAEIAERGSVAQLPLLTSTFERDLFALYEAASAEYAIATRHAGFRHTLASLRRRARIGVPRWPAASNALVRSLRASILGVAPEMWPDALPPRLESETSRAWAATVASSYNPRLYVPSRHVWHWGAMIGGGAIRPQDPFRLPEMGTINLPIGSAPQPGSSARGSIAQQSNEGGTPDTSSLGGMSSVGTPDDSGTALDPWNQPSGDIPGLDANAVIAARYHEWDHALREFDRDRVFVFESTVAAGDDTWGRQTAARHRGLIRRVEREFQTLGSHRVRLARQPDGDDLDLQAVLDMHVALRSRGAPDERVYAVTRPPRGGVALAMLADISGSAETLLASGLRVIDVEKIALLVATHALETTGDRHAILAFASRGARRVAVRSAKAFDERGGAAVGARIASLTASGNTRLGAAIRHATSVLLRERASRHLMLIVSDGIPNDSDGYVDAYAIEDARMAVLEARARGVMPHCLTLSADEHYALKIFGNAAQVLVRRPEQLPAAMLDVLGRLLRR